MAAVTLPVLQLSRYRFTLVADELLTLPPWKGSALRGGFGHAFKSMVCFQPAVKTCADCLLRYTCPYPYIFETPLPPETELLSSADRVPPPLILEPPLTEQTGYPPGSTLTFGVTLVGRAVDYLPYFLVAFQELGRGGLGRTRGRFHLAEVVALHPLAGVAVESVYTAAQPTHIRARALPLELPALVAAAEQLPTDRLTIEFRTPTRLKHDDHLVRQGPPFQALVKVLLGRISSLSYFHCGQRWEMDFRGWIDQAAAVALAATETRWVDWERYSGRQQQRIAMGGLVGRATYTGDLAPYRALLLLGTLIHVGKGTVFGNGAFAVTDCNRREETG